MKSILVHLMSAFAFMHVKSNGNDIDVYGPEGHVLAVRDGRCQSKELGCSREFTLDPIPRDARLFKEVDGKIVRDEKYEERLQLRKKYLDADGVCKSIAVLKREGRIFDEKGNDLTPAPVKVAASSDESYSSNL